MKRFMLFLSMLAFIIGYGQLAGAQPGAVNDLETLDYVPGEVLVTLKRGLSAQSIAPLHAQIASQALESFSSDVGKKSKVVRVKLKRGMSVQEGISYYRENQHVVHAQPNYIYRLAGIPNDPLFGELWGLHNTGQMVNGTAGTTDADIDAPEAWDIATGKATVVVAVIDTGVAINHPGLADNIWRNPGETNCADGIDNEGNGYIDDCFGWDFFDDDNDPAGFHPHGTHVAGTIGAVGNDGTGVTGVNWNVKIMPLKISGVVAFTSVATQAINYAAANGARVINASWGGPGGADVPGDLLRDAIEAAGNAGVLFVAGAGNGGNDGIGDSNDTTPFYPASYSLDSIISVAATDQDDNLTSFSNYGLTSVDVAAPGANILSTVPQYSYGTPVILYSTNFDSDTGGQVPSGWARGGTNSTWAVSGLVNASAPNSLEDSPGDYLNNTNSWIVYDSLIPYTKDNRYKVKFKMRYDIETGYDWACLVGTPDKVNVLFSPEYCLTGSSGGVFDLLTAGVTQFVELGWLLGFGLQSDFSFRYDGVYIDDLTVTREQMSISGHSYDYFNGTSMAAPHVAGLAALLLSQNPGLTVLQLGDAILGGVDSKPSLSGKVATGGRINAYTSLNLIPVPSADLVVDFGSYGTFVYYNNSTWAKLHSVSPGLIATGNLDGSGGDEVIMDFPGYGTFVYYNDSTWVKLHGLSPGLMATGDLDGTGGDEVIMGFPGYGTFVYYNNGTWVKLHNLSPELMATGDLDGTGGDEVIMGFPGYGTFVYDGAWTKIHSLSPELIATGDLDGNGLDDVVLDFTGYGTFIYYNNSTWEKLHSLSPGLMATGDLDGNGLDDVVLDFTGYGTFVYYNNSTWVKLHNLSPGFMATGDLDGSGKDDVVLDFTGYGTFIYYNNSTWEKLHGLSPDNDAGIVAGNVDGN